MRKIVARCGLVAVLLAVCSCDRSMDDRDNDSKTANAAEAQVVRRGDGEPTAQVLDDQQALSRRRSELQAQIETVQSQQAALQQEYARVSALVQSHQSDSEQKLAALKAEFTALQEREPGNTQSRDEFAERARNDLEAALSLDQEHLAQLGEVQKGISDADTQLGELRAELESLESRE